MRDHRTRTIVIVVVLVILAIIVMSVLVWRRPTPLPTSAPIASATASLSTSPSPATSGQAINPSPSSGASPAPWRVGDPNPALTPGAIDPAITQANIGTTICVSGYTATVRPPSSYTTSLKKQQIVAYGYTDTSTASYEEDHLISLEIGGAPRDPLNLWPEPYTVIAPDGSNVGARTKDKMENYLHRMVCSGAMTLAIAQDQAAHDWLGHWLADGSPSG